MSSGHESEFTLPCLRGSGRLRLLAHGICRGLYPLFLDGQARGVGLPAVSEPGGQPQRTAFPGPADGPDWTQAGFPRHGNSQVPVPGLWGDLRGLPPFAPAYVSYTTRLQTFIEDLFGVMTVADLAQVTYLSWDTVKNIVKKRLERDYGHPRLKALERLSIDEIYLGRRKKFYTVVIDLDTGRIVWVAQGRGGDALRKFWRALRLSKAKIQAVAMDMSAAYWAAVAENLPKAAIVFDRFHIMKLVNEKLDDLRRDLVREATGLMKHTVKGIRYLLLMRREKVEEEKLPRLDQALHDNEPLFIGYLLKEALGLLWEQPSYARMKSFLHEWCSWASESGIRQMMQLAKTLLTHASGILSWWKHPINNGRMEGINNKIKTLLRQTYGLRDERYFVLRLFALHHSRHELLG
jgi:transposase